MQDASSIYQYSSHTRFHFNYVTPVNQPLALQGLRLYQVGDLHAAPGYQIGRHVQRCHEVSYIRSGEGRYFVNGKSFPVKQGDILLTRRGELHAGVSNDKNPLRNYYLGFDIDHAYLRKAPYMEIAALFEREGEVLASGHPEIAPMFIGIFQELINQHSCHSQMIEGFVHQMLITVCRIYLGRRMYHYNPERDSNPSVKLAHTVLQYIDAHLEEITHLTDLARIFGYSYSHLAQAFKDRMGLSPYQYYHRKRFDRAVELLREESCSITQVADQLGYQSLHAFSKAFHKRFGISPSQYLALSRQKKQFPLAEEIPTDNPL